MARGTSSRRLAQAAFEVAIAREGLEAWEKDLLTVKSVLSNADVVGFMDSPQVPLEVKVAGLKTLLGGVSPRVRNFVSVLVARNHVRRIDSVIREFATLADGRRGIARATVSTAVPLDDQRRSMVTSALGNLTGKKVVLTERVDASLLGGIVARVGDRLIDGSSRTRLHDLRSALAERPV